MEVILLEPVRKLGNVGEVVTVKNGFARNYLIPTKKALRSTKENVAYFESKKSEIEKANEAKTAEAEKTAKAIEGTFITLITQAGEDGRLYGSVTPLDIARPLESVDRKQVVLVSPIKYIGVYEVEIQLIGDVSATVNVNVARTDSEAKEAEKRFKAGETVMEGPGTAEEVQQAEEAPAVEEKAEEEPKKEAASKDEEKAEAPKEEAKEETATKE